MKHTSELSRAALAALVLAATLGMLGPRTLVAQEMAMKGPEMAMKGLHVGDMAPTARVKSLDGADVDLARFVGKTPVLIEFWATWCPLCKQLEPAIQALHDKYQGKLEIVHIVVPQNQTPDRAREYAEKHKLPGRFFFDANGEAYKAFAAYHTSYIVVLNAKGTVVHSDAGTTQDLAAAVAKAVQ
jgi:thiol-disulfide isomerase/thioredoxin